MRQVTGRCQRNTMRRVGCLGMRVIGQSGCFTRQPRLKTLPGGGWWSDSENRSSHDHQLWLGLSGTLSRRRGHRQQRRADVVAVGGCDVAVGGSEVEDDVAGSTSIGGGGGGNGALNTSFGGFFKALDFRVAMQRADVICQFWW
uniref:Uncharacterized protein n=1 Tax=Romanomermis culicivorax TaxID=13658 RepID=A0A915IV45_ROMCU